MMIILIIIIIISHDDTPAPRAPPRPRSRRSRLSAARAGRRTARRTFAPLTSAEFAIMSRQRCYACIVALHCANLLLCLFVGLFVLYVLLAPRQRARRRGRARGASSSRSRGREGCAWSTPNPPTNIIPTTIAWRKLSGRSPMGLGIPPLRIKMMLESNPRKSTTWVWTSVNLRVRACEQVSNIGSP